jgi:hypothetical protein
MSAGQGHWPTDLAQGQGTLFGQRLGTDPRQHVHEAIEALDRLRAMTDIVRLPSPGRDRGDRAAKVEIDSVSC